MARDISKNHREGYEIDFYYSAQSRLDMIHAEELTAISSEYPNLRFIPFPSDELGYLSTKEISEKSKDFLDKDVYICGPPAMIKSLMGQFKAVGKSINTIHSEEFRLL